MCSYVIYWMWMSVSVSPMFKRATHFHHDVRWFSLYKMYAKVRQFFLSYTYIYIERDWLTSAVPSVQRVQLTQCFFPPFYLPLDPPPLIAYQITAPIFNVCEFFGKIRKKKSSYLSCTFCENQSYTKCTKRFLWVWYKLCNLNSWAEITLGSSGREVEQRWTTGNKVLSIEEELKWL